MNYAIACVHMDYRLYTYRYTCYIQCIYTDLHDSADVSVSDLLIGLAALDHQTNLDVLLHVAGILIHTRELITSLVCLTT